MLPKDSTLGCGKVIIANCDDIPIAHSVKISGSVLFLRNSLCHIWGNNGEHIGWRKSREVLDAAKQLYTVM